MGWITATKRTSRPAGRQQVAYVILDDHLALAVDGTFGLLAALGIFQQRPEPDLAVIDLGPAPLSRAALLMDGVGDGVGLHPGDQMVVLLEQAGDDPERVNDNETPGSGI